MNVSLRSYSYRNRRRRTGKGVMLILTLWLTVVLSILASSLISHILMQTRLMSLRRHRLIADSLARAGAAKVIADLKNDILLDHSEKAEAFDAEGDIWKRPEEGHTDQKLGSGTYSVEVVDEESKINLNAASPKVLAALMQQLGYEEQDALDAASAIIDWRDSDDNPCLSNTTAGREREIYAILMKGGDPGTASFKDVKTIRIKNDAFTTVDELLGVYGITPEIFYGPGSEEAETAAAEMGDQLAFANKRFRIKHTRKHSDGPPVGLRDCLTVHSNATVNLNTASLEVLCALLRASGANATDPEGVAERIIEYRRDGARKDIRNNRAFHSTSDLEKAGSLGTSAGQLGSAYSVGVLSWNFRITSTGKSGSSSRTITMIVSRSLETYVRSENFDEIESKRGEERHYQLGEGRSDSDALKSKKLGPDERTVLWPAVRVLQWIEP